MSEISINKIHINSRFRRDIGDVSALSKSIDEVGLLHPVVIDEEDNLVAGQRRIEAAKLLGWETIPYTRISIDEIVHGEYAENAYRKDFTPSEMVAISKAIKPVEAERARERQGVRTDLTENFGKVSDRHSNETMNKVGAFVGVSGRTLEKAEAVVDSGDEELVTLMDTKSVDKAYNELRKRKQAEDLIKKETAPPTGEYDVIVIDPPWPMQKIDREVRPNQYGFDYRTISIDDLHNLKIPASKNAHIFLWTTQKYLPTAYQLFDAWGVRYVCTFVWHKPGGFQPVGLPQYNCEFVLYGRIGTPEFYSTKAFFTCFNAARGKHSEKPDEFFATVKNATFGKRLSMYERKQREGFEGWGDEFESMAN